MMKIVMEAFIQKTSVFLICSFNLFKQCIYLVDVA